MLTMKKLFYTVALITTLNSSIFAANHLPGHYFKKVLKVANRVVNNNDLQVILNLANQIIENSNLERKIDKVIKLATGVTTDISDLLRAEKDAARTIVYTAYEYTAAVRMYRTPIFKSNGQDLESVLWENDGFSELRPIFTQILEDEGLLDPNANAAYGNEIEREIRDWKAIQRALALTNSAHPKDRKRADEKVPTEKKEEISRRFLQMIDNRYVNPEYVENFLPVARHKEKPESSN